MGLFSNSASKDAERAARRQENTRQGRINQNVQAVNSAYAGREPQYAKFEQALRGQYGDQIKQQQDKAGRLLKFSLARGGLTGGSADADLTANFDRESGKATLLGEQKAQAAVGGLRSADEQARLNNISLAQSGGNVGNAALQASNALRANLESAQSAANPENIGDLFASTAGIFKTQQDAAARRRGLRDSDPYGNNAAGIP